jgi:hypothetical protein
MEVREMQFTQTNNISSSMDKFQIDQDKSIAFNVKSINSKIEEKNKEIKSIRSFIKRISIKIEDKENKISNLDSLSKKNGSDSCVRLKSGNFKAGKPDNFVKKLLNGNRYGDERKDAAKYIDVEGGSVSVIVAKSKLNKDLDGLKKDSYIKNETLKNNETDLGDLIKTRNNLLNSPTKYNPSARTPSDKIQNGGKDEVQQRRDFSAIYQTNIGCSAINSQARAIYRESSVAKYTVSKTKLKNEYKRAHGDNIFEKGNKDLGEKIKTLSGDIPKLVNDSIKAFYTPSPKNIKTTRGQGMTIDGLNSLIKGKDDNITYKLGQFFSTSKDTKVAENFARASSDEVKVLFTIYGNSSNSLLIQGGLAFEEREQEKLYSPLANFKVTAVSKSNDLYNVTLKEQDTEENAPLFPY